MNHCWAALSDAPDPTGAFTAIKSLIGQACAAWRVAPALAALESHFAGGVHPAVHDLLSQLGAVEVDFPDDAQFANLNTRDDIARAEAI